MGIYRTKPAEDVTFLDIANIQIAVNTMPNNKKIDTDASKSINFDEDVIEIIEEFEILAKA